MSPSEKIAKLLDEAAKIAAAEFDDSDIFNYGRAYEYLMAGTLGHQVSKTKSGCDGYDDEGTYEYKSKAFGGYDRNGNLRNHSFNYYGFSRFASYEDQVAYVTDKIMRDRAHYWGIKCEVGFDFEAVFRVDSKVVLDVFLSKLENEYYNIKKDPRINITISLRDVGNEAVRIK